MNTRIRKFRFTIMELIVSMSVLAVMMVIMMEFFASAQKAWVASSEQADIYDNARVALDLITSDINALYYKKSSKINFRSEDDLIGFMVYNSGKLTKIMYKRVDDDNDDDFCFFKRGDGKPGDYVNAASISSVFADSSVDYKKVIPRVIDLEFKYYNKKMEAFTEGDYKIPWFVEVKITLMGRNSFVKWKAFTEKNVSSKAEEIAKAHSVTVSKLITIGYRGQPD